MDYSEAGQAITAEINYDCGAAVQGGARRLAN